MSGEGITRFEKKLAGLVAWELLRELDPAAERLIVAGSLRRGEATVGDVEIVYVPRMREVREDLFATTEVSMVDEVLERLLAAGVLEKRLSRMGRASWGPQNKYARHAETGIPVDFFRTSQECWWNYLACRTGPAESNAEIARRALAKGWKWEPYGRGFRRNRDGAVHVVRRERDVFEFVGMPVPTWVDLAVAGAGD